MADLLDEIRDRLQGRVVLVGVGNPLRGDDAVGPRLVERLQGRTRAHLVDAGEVPENEVVRVADMDPDVVVVVDAADLGAEPGALGLIESEAFGRTAFSTHNPSMGPFAAFLAAATACTVFAIGVQPRQMEFDTPLSAEVEATLQVLADVIAGACPA